jgi:WD40 repeat protein
MKQLIKLFAIAVAVAGLAVEGAYGQVLYAADGQGGIAGNLYIINPATGGVVRTIGPIGFAVTGLAFHPTTGVLYGTTGAENDPPALITINTTTGAGTLVGNNTCGPIADITFRNDGTLFGWTECNDRLVTVNTATGIETEIGTGTGSAGSGIAFSPGGTLYFTGNNSNGALRTVDPVTGVTTVVVTMTGGPPPNRVNALAFGPGGTLYGSVKQSPGDTLVTINTTTGVVTTVGSLPPGTDAIVFGPAAQQTPVPTLSQWALIALTVLIAASVVAMRRRA